MHGRRTSPWVFPAHFSWWRTSPLQKKNHRHSRREEFVHEAACVGEGNTEPFVIFKIHEQSLENDCHSLTRVPFEGFFRKKYSNSVRKGSENRFPQSASPYERCGSAVVGLKREKVMSHASQDLFIVILKRL